MAPYGYGDFDPYVPVATRRARAAKYAKELARKAGREPAPVVISGHKIAVSYWGQAWCDNLESYSDYANRLPRGRTYARNGSVVDLQISHGEIEAIVGGSDVYEVSIYIETLTPEQWTDLKAECSQSISSLIDLLQGKFDTGVMQRLAHPTRGLFPRPKEILMRCSCPDGAVLCKHVAAVLYGVGSRLDTAPEMLFLLRNVDHLELVGQAVADVNLNRTLGADDDDSLAGADLGEMFGIELGEPDSQARAGNTCQKPCAATEGPADRSTGRKPTRKAPAKPKSTPARRGRRAASSE